MKTESFRCDICQAEKKDGNHWWKGYPVIGGGFAVIPWNREPGELDRGVELHLCGEAHAIQWVSENLEKK